MAEGFFRGLMGYPPAAAEGRVISTQPKVYNKNKDGHKVPGDHRKSVSTLAPTSVEAVGGKLSQSIRNYWSKKQAWDYHAEILRYLPELHQFPNAHLTAKQKDDFVKIGEKLKQNKDTKRYEELRPLIDKYVIGEQAPPPPADIPMRPEGTPTRYREEDQEEAPPPKRPDITPRHFDFAQVEEPQAGPSNQTEPIDVDQEPSNMSDGNTGPSGGADAAGNDCNWRCKSFQPEYQHTPDGLKIIFKGSRMMYTWGMDMRTHNVANIGDFVPAGHSYPWEWIPTYCTVAEWNSLPWKTHEMNIAKVGVQITPIGKESQFNTSSGTSVIASNEHLTVGYKAVGFNHDPSLPGTGYRRIQNNTTDAKLITNSSTAIDYSDLRKRFWGPLSDFTLNSDPVSYGTGAQVSCAEGSIRELEVVSGIYVDKFDKATKGNNKASFGSVLKDRYIERFPLMPAMGKPIISEVYEPKCGIINTQPHRVLLKNSKNYMVNGPQNTARNVWCVEFGSGTGAANKIITANTPEASNWTYSRNTNVGTNVQIGSYHALVEKYRFAGTDGDSQADQHSGKSMPMLTFGLCPIRLVNFTSSAPEYVNARVVWKIDYFMEINCKFMVPSHPFATNISADGSEYPANMYTSMFPKIYMNPCGFSTTEGQTNLPSYESVDPTAVQSQLEGHIQYTYTNDGTLTDITGAGGVKSWAGPQGGLTT